MRLLFDEAQCELDADGVALTKVLKYTDEDINWCNGAQMDIKWSELNWQQKPPCEVKLTIVYKHKSGHFSIFAVYLI